MVWDNGSHEVKINRCRFTHQDINQCGNYTTYGIPTNISAPDLNYMTCNSYNRQDTQCRQCIDGYGPAAFSDGITCADCSRQRHMWVLNLLFQLTMVTLMYSIVILFQVKGSSSPFNVLITYSQLGVNALMIGSGTYTKVVCFTNHKLVLLILTLLGVWNLDFFRLVIPPLCVSTSMKAVNILLLDYVVAFYPLVLTVFSYIGIELHDRNCRIIVYLCTPLKMVLHGNWNPKETILSTCATFLLLTYSKFLFVSVCLLLGVPSYNCNGDVIPNSTVLFYDPTIRFFHSEHIPYVVLALSIVVFIVLLPPLLLLLYPAQFFRKCLNCCGFQRWDILHLIMDIFQGWYKDGTEGTYDYRPLSALYMLLRVAISCLFVVKLLNGIRSNWYIFGLSHVFLGTFFLIAKPYKKKWMSHTDGLILISFGTFILTNTASPRINFIAGAVIGLMVVTSVCLFVTCKCLKRLLC